MQRGAKSLALQRGTAVFKTTETSGQSLVAVRFCCIWFCGFSCGILTVLLILQRF